MKFLNLFLLKDFYFIELNKTLNNYLCLNSFTNYNFNKDILINFCFFNYLTNSNGFGGAIFLNSSNSLDIIINYCSFFQCSSSNYGGAISILSINGSSLLSKVCGSECYTSLPSSLAQFSFFNSKLSFLNILNYISVYKSAPNHLILRAYPIRCYEGIQNVSNLNSTSNNLNTHSGFVTIKPSSFNSIFCNFKDNNSTNFECIMLHSNSGVMKFSNIVNNNSPTGYGVIYNTVNGNYQLLNCIFLNNKDCLFYFDTGNLIIQDSYIYHLNYSIGNDLIHSNRNNQYLYTNSYYFEIIKCNFKFSINYKEKKKKEYIFILYTLLNLIN